MKTVANSRITRLLILATAACWASCGGDAAANLLTNGGFETGDFTGWTVNNAGWGQYVSVSGGFTNGTSPFGGGGGAQPYEGTHFAALGIPTSEAGGGPFPGDISQVIPTIPGDNYTFSFAYFVEPAGTGNNQHNQFTAIFGSSTPLNTLNDQSGTTDVNGNNVWTPVSYIVTATSNLTTIDLQTGNYQWGNGLDAVSVTFLNPEPSSMILLGLAGVGLAFAVRRRKVARTVAAN